MRTREGHAGVWHTRTYDRLAPYYDRLFRFLFPGDIKAKRLLVKGMKPGRVLDIACGTGTLLELAAGAGMECFGMDLSPGMVARARRKLPAAEFKCASFYDIPWPDDHFDYVVETNAVSAVGVDFRAVASEMLRVCRPGGEIRIGDYARPENPGLGARLVEKLGNLIGDACPDYRAVFRSLGHETDETPLHTFGVYRLITVRKPPAD